MPNQNNFRSNVTTNTEITYLASRIVRVPEESIFLQEVPGSFGYDNEDNIEVHFYSIPTNQLILSTRIKLDEGILKQHIVSYQDGTYKNYVRIDFTKMFEDKVLLLVPGDYYMVLNFFSDEVGSYDNKNLAITNISETRTEVELKLLQTKDAVNLVFDENLLIEFIDKSFQKPDAVGVIEKIFTSGVELEDPTEGVTATGIIQNIAAGNQTFADTIARIERIGLREEFEAQLNDFITKFYRPMVEKIVTEGDERIQPAEIELFIRQAVPQLIANLKVAVDPRIIVS